jgi:hypothetical protein
MGIRYKFEELSVVTDETLEEVINRRVREGWTLESIHFAMRESSKRPSMGFIAFVRDDPDDDHSQG